MAMSPDTPTATEAISTDDLVARAEAWMAADVDDADIAELRNLIAKTDHPTVAHLAGGAGV
jgi:phosphomannomutase